jgi:hypothetical protein
LAGEDENHGSYPLPIEHPPKDFITGMAVEGRPAARQNIIWCWLHLLLLGCRVVDDSVVKGCLRCCFPHVHNSPQKFNRLFWIFVSSRENPRENMRKK